MRMTAPTINLNLAQLDHVPAIAQWRAEANGFRVVGEHDIAVVKESLGSPRSLWIVALKDEGTALAGADTVAAGEGLGRVGASPVRVHLLDDKARLLA